MRATAIVHGFLAVALAASVARSQEVARGGMPTFDLALEILQERQVSFPQDTPDGHESAVWNSRFYLEALCMAYRRTRNPHYAEDFIRTADWILDEVKTLSVSTLPDPTRQDHFGQPGPRKTLVGWPTNTQALGMPILIPDLEGQPSLWVQNLRPTMDHAATHFRVEEDPAGGVRLGWWNGQDMETRSYPTGRSLDELRQQFSRYGHSYGRIVPMGKNMPQPGFYRCDQALPSIRHADQTAGLLLPILKFMVQTDYFAEGRDREHWERWKATIARVLATTGDCFVEDGAGGLILRNPSYLTHAHAGLPVPANYAYVEIMARLLYYRLSNDPEQLSLASRLLQHQRSHWKVSDQGWLILAYWPDGPQWASNWQGLSVWEAMNADPALPEESSHIFFLTELLDLAQGLGLSQALGLDPYRAVLARALEEYVLNLPRGGAKGVIQRDRLPSMRSTSSDPLVPLDNPFLGSYLLAYAELSQRAKVVLAHSLPFTMDSLWTLSQTRLGGQKLRALAGPGAIPLGAGYILKAFAIHDLFAPVP
jgi:hypothetical protein